VPSRNAAAPMVGAYQAYDTDLRAAVPAMSVSREDYGRLVHLVRHARRPAGPRPRWPSRCARASTRRARAPTRRA
jgi:hypothetical protein